MTGDRLMALDLDYIYATLESGFTLVIIILIICFLIVYYLETDNIAFSHRLQWERKDWAVTRPAATFYANYLDYFNQLQYKEPATIAWKLREYFLKSLSIQSGKEFITSKNGDYSFIKSEELREFCISPKKWTRSNIGKFDVTSDDPAAYLEAIGIITVPFNKIINLMRLELGLEPVQWESVPYKRQNPFLKIFLLTVIKGSISLIICISFLMFMSFYASQYPGSIQEQTRFVKDLKLLSLLLSPILFTWVYLYVSDRIITRIRIFIRRVNKFIFKKKNKYTRKIN